MGCSDRDLHWDEPSTHLGRFYGPSCAFGELHGALIETVAGRSVTELSLLTRVFYPAENKSARNRRLATSLGTLRLARELIPDLEDSLRLSVQLPGTNTTRNVLLLYNLTREERREGPWSRSAVSRIAPVNGPFGHAMLDQNGAGYLRINAMWSREAFERMRTSGRTDIDKWLTHAYKRFMDGAQPADRDEAISGFPSLIEEVATLLEEMRERGVRDLIVDLSGNDGGFSIIAEPLLYQLFGSSYLEAPDPVYFATRVSPELLDIQGRTLAELAEVHGRDVLMGDILFDPPRSRVRPSMTSDQLISRFRRIGFTRTDLLDRELGGNLRVVAITDAGTFSAAFELTYQLHRMGATLVGVPPSQSPNAFTDSTPYELSNSGLKGSMSRSAVVYPGIPSEGGAIVMDVPLTWAKLQACDFHPDAALYAALELLNRGAE